jgi:hypothetical protein
MSAQNDRVVQMLDAVSAGPTAITTRASDIKPRDLDPVWPGVLWAGKPTLFAGDPGLGKSMVTCDIAARVTTGLAVFPKPLARRLKW